MFEQFGVPGFYLANQGSLALSSMGLTSGLCVNLGFNCSQALPVYEGSILDDVISSVDVGGNQVTNYLGHLLQASSGVTFSSSSEKLVLNQMKENYAYVALGKNFEFAN